MYKIKVLIPLNLTGDNSLPPAVCESLVSNSQPLRLGEIVEKKRGKTGKQFVVENLGECQVAFRGSSLIAEALIERLPEDRPYIRVAYKVEEDGRTLASLVFSKEPGDLKQPNYTWEKV